MASLDTGEFDLSDRVFSGVGQPASPSPEIYIDQFGQKTAAGPLEFTGEEVELSLTPGGQVVFNGGAKLAEAAPPPIQSNPQTERPAPMVQQDQAAEAQLAPLAAPVVAIESPLAKGVMKEGLGRLAKMLKAAKVKPSTAGAAHAFSLSDASLHPFVLDMIFTALFGDWHDWEAETLDHALTEIATDGGGAASATTRTKLQAMQILHATNYPWISMGPFAKIALALDNRIPDFSSLEPVHPGTMLVALQIMREIKPEHALSHEVLRFIAVNCVHDGLMVFPDPVISESVNQVISRLVNHSVSGDELLALNALWKQVADKGGAVELNDRELDEIDETNLGDYQLSMAARAAAYLAAADERKMGQLQSLASWLENMR